MAWRCYHCGQLNLLHSNTPCCCTPSAVLCCHRVALVLCRRHHCDAVVVVHCSTPFGASDALAPMNYCATVRPVSLLARSPREPRLFAPRASSRAHLASLEWLHSTCLLAPCLPGCSHRATNSGASGLSATTSATLTVITSHHHIVTPNHLRI